MKNIIFIVIGLTLFLLFYTLMPHLGATYNLMFILFLIGNLLLLYMVYHVLKFGEEPKEKFDEGYWYSDVDKQYSKGD